MVTVRAITDFEHHGMAVQSEDEIRVTVTDALRLRGEGKVSLSLRPGERLRASAPDVDERQADVHAPSALAYDPPPDDPMFPIDETSVPDAASAPRGESLTANNDPDVPAGRRRRGRRSYQRAEIDVPERTDLDADQ